MKKSIVVTGAAGGIGQAICRYFHERDWTVIGLDKGIESVSYCHHTLNFDLKALCDDAGTRENLARRLRDLAVHVLVNNAAVQRLGSLPDVKLADWNETLQVNVTAPMLLSQMLLPQLSAVRGHIINIASIHGQLTKPAFVAYATSKAALIGFTKSLAVDVGDKVSVNSISPAAIATDMLLDGFKDAPERYQMLKDFHPSKSVGQPEEVAGLVYFIANSGGAFLNGANFCIDGGIGGRLHDPV